MAIHFQTFSPSTCECVIEQQFDDEVENPTPELAFFHKVCNKHKPLVKTVSKKNFDKKSKEVMNNLETALKINRDRNLKGYDEHPHIKQRNAAAKTLKVSKDTEKYGLMLETEANNERYNIVKGLDDHENAAKLRILNGIHSPDTFGTEDVYNAILSEQKSIIENDG